VEELVDPDGERLQLVVAAADSMIVFWKYVRNTEYVLSEWLGLSAQAVAALKAEGAL
jgi:hypothetical protein